MFAGGIDSSATEMKGIVLNPSAEQVHLDKENFF